MLAARAWRRRERLRGIADSFREIRAAASTPAVYAPAAVNEQVAGDARATRIPPGTRAFGPITQYRGNQAQLTLRWFVDDAGTTWGSVGTLRNLAVMRLWSTNDDLVWLTQVTFRRTTVAPGAPFMQPAWATLGKGHLHAVAAHRARVAAAVASAAGGSVAGAGALRELRTREDLCAWLTDLARRIAAWRDTQSPNALLEYDLRQLLGPRYDRDAPVLARRLQIVLPTAKLLP